MSPFKRYRRGHYTLAEARQHEAKALRDLGNVARGWHKDDAAVQRAMRQAATRWAEWRDLVARLGGSLRSGCE